MRKSVLLVFFALAVLLSVLNVVLIRRNRGLEAKVQSLRKDLLLQAGATVPPIAGKDLRGDPIRIPYSQSTNKTVMLVFSPNCGACESNWPKWDLDIRVAEWTGARVVAVNLAPTLSEGYLEQHGLKDRLVVAAADPSCILDYKLRFTPQTIVIGPDSKVEWVWTGALSEKAQGEFSRVLGGGLASDSRRENRHFANAIGFIRPST